MPTPRPVGRPRSAAHSRAGRRRAHARSGRRFGPTALMVAAFLAGASGAATGTVLDRPDVVAQVVSPAVVQAAPPREPHPSPAPTAVPDDDATRSSVDRTPPALALEVPTALPMPTPLPTPEPDDGLSDADRAAGVLSAAKPRSADGQLVVVAGSDPAPRGRSDVRTVRVEVEKGLDVNRVAFADMVMETLNDRRGWGADGVLGFARTDGRADLRVVLASPAKVDEMCAPLETVGRYSCGRYGHAALNHTRWVAATEEFDDLTLYRQYLVNHEVGHLLGHGHEECPAAGARAPLMQQQTVGVAPCVPNAWPFP